MVDPLEPAQMRTYFALTEAVSLLQHAVQAQLQADGGLSYVQFEILAKLLDAGRALSMTELADGVVYSRSGLTHQAALLQERGLVDRHSDSRDQRATLVEITAEGRRRVNRVLPGHIHVVRQLLFDCLTDQEVSTLGDIMVRALEQMRALPPRSAGSRRRGSAASR